MKDIILINFIERARRAGKAVLIETAGNKCVDIQPEDNFRFEYDCMILDEHIIDCNYISHVEFTKTAAEKEEEFEEFKRILYEVNNETV